MAPFRQPERPNIFGVVAALLKLKIFAKIFAHEKRKQKEFTHFIMKKVKFQQFFPILLKNKIYIK